MADSRRLKVRTQDQRELGKLVAAWIDSHGPRGAGVPVEDAAAYVLSVIGTLLHLAANVAEASQANGIAVSEDDFVSMARKRYRRHAQRPGRPSA